MSKVLVIEKCTQCFHFNMNMYGERCFHPDVVTPCNDDEGGVIPRDVPYKDPLNIIIPDWCPLQDEETPNIAKTSKDSLEGKIWIEEIQETFK
jgi:hypothetical protein